MNKYNDIQQFKNKINSPEIDYKEFPAEDMMSIPCRWPIVKQVAENCIASTPSHRPTPVPVTDSLFSVATSAGLSPASPPTGAADDLKEHSNKLKSFAREFEHFVPPSPASFNHPPIVEPINTRSCSSLDKAAGPLFAKMKAAKTEEHKRFKQMFSRKAVAVDEGETQDCNTLLKPLFESIASCR